MATDIKSSNSQIAVTPSAAKRIAQIKSEQNADDLALRISVSGGGCSGFQYHFDLDHGADDDIVIKHDDATVVVDTTSALYLSGSELDFIEDLTGSYFRISNPNASSSCGCGNSFSI